MPIRARSAVCFRKAAGSMHWRWLAPGSAKLGPDGTSLYCVLTIGLVSGKRCVLIRVLGTSLLMRIEGTISDLNSPIVFRLVREARRMRLWSDGRGVTSG